MLKVINIIARELGKGTLDKTCSTDERMEIRKAIYKYKLLSSTKSPRK